MMIDALKRLKHEAPNDVELWLVDLDVYAKDIAFDGLSADDHARAARMAFEQDARRYLASRHALRSLLATALNRSAGSLIIRPDEVGKPRLISDGALQFNLSHSGRVCLIGLSSRESIGVDVEVVRTIVDAGELARLHFTDEERHEWAGAGPRSDATFLACWTRKEACLKALGVGLSASPVAMATGCTNTIRKVYVPLRPRRCIVTLYPVQALGNAVAAVALAPPESAMIAPQFFDFQPEPSPA